jgi:hypothetical protein
MAEIYGRVELAVLTWLTDGMEAAMNRFNPGAKA